MSDFFSNKTILLPFDYSDVATSAVDDALSMADETSRICMLHVLVPLYAISVEPGMMIDLGDDQERVDGAVKGMKEMVNNPTAAIEYEARIGDPSGEIVDYAKEIGADLIVMPSHGRTGLKRLLLGSVAERVVRHAECPVMVLRKPRSD